MSTLTQTRMGLSSADVRQLREQYVPKGLHVGTPVVVLDALLFGLAGRDRAAALGAAEELQELRARINERMGVAG